MSSKPQSGHVLGWSRPGGLGTSQVERVQSFGLTRDRRRKQGSGRSSVDSAARQAYGHGDERANSAPLRASSARHMDAIHEAGQLMAETMHEDRLPERSASQALPRVPGASDFSALSETVHRHLNEQTEPVCASENEVFVQELQKSISEELKVLGCPAGGASLPRLQVYRQSFDILIKHFRSYRPMLSMIKQEYDNHLDYLLAQCEELKRLESDIGLSQYKREQEVVRTLTDFKQTQSKLESTLAEKHQRIRVTERRLGELHQEVGKYQAAQETLAKALEDGQCSNKNLRSRVEHLVDTIGEAKREEDPEMRKAYNKSKREYDKLFKEMSDLRHQLLHVLVQPRELDEAQQRFEVLQREEAEARRAKLDAAEQLHELACEERRLDKHKAALLERLRVCTPRPDWSKPEKILNLQGMSFSAEADSTKKRVDDLVSKIAHMQSKKTEYKARLSRWGEEQTKAGNNPANKQNAHNNKYITALGTDDPKVAAYLQFDGKVRRREIPKRDTELLLHDIWEEKSKHDEALQAEGGRRSTLRHFLHVYLTKRFGLQAIVAEWGYNLLEALNKHRYDADCECFLHVLKGSMSEDFLKNQEKMISNFEGALQAQHSSGTVHKKALVEYFQAFFDSKSEERCQEALEALDEQCPEEGQLAIAELFGENRQGDQGPFAETLRDHDLAERQEYLEDIEEALTLQMNAEALEQGLAPDGTLTHQSVHAALIKMDQGLADISATGPQHNVYTSGSLQLQAITCTGFRVREEPAPEASIRLELFMRRIMKMALRRFARKVVANEGDRLVELVFTRRATDMTQEEEDEEDEEEEPGAHHFSPEEHAQLAKHLGAISQESIPLQALIDALVDIAQCDAGFAERLGRACDYEGSENIRLSEFEVCALLLGEGSAEQRVIHMFGVYETHQEEEEPRLAKEALLSWCVMAGRLSAYDRAVDQLRAQAEAALGELELDLERGICLEECLQILQHPAGYLAGLFAAL